MRETPDLNTQIAQRLFGWVHTDPHWWRDAQGAHHAHIPVYATEHGATDPAATARVWQWVEEREVLSIALHYAHRLPAPVLCQIGTTAHGTVTGYGATWPEALCRAALALAAALEQEGTA